MDEASFLPLWDRLVAPDRPERGITYFARGERVTGGRAETPAKMARVLANLSRCGFNVYVNLNPSGHSGIKGSTEDVRWWRHVIVDVDPVEPDAAPALALAAIRERLPQHQTIIDTGRGAQIWLPVEPLRLDGQHQMIEARMRRWLGALHRDVGMLHGCSVDTSCSDLARVARLPGGINQKTGRIARLVQLANGYNDQTLFDALEEVVEEFAGPIVPGLGRNLHRLTGLAGTFLYEGVSAPGRHKAAYAAAKNLQELGMDQEQAAELVARGGRMCAPRLSRMETDRAVRSAYRRRR